jgi:hypothetical protein
MGDLRRMEKPGTEHFGVGHSACAFHGGESGRNGSIDINTSGERPAVSIEDVGGGVGDLEVGGDHRLAKEPFGV